MSATVPIGAKVAIVFAVGCSTGFNVGKVPIALPALRSDFGLSLVEASFVLSMLLLTSVLAGVFGGMLADRYGQRRAILFGLALAIVGGLLGGFARSPAELFVSRAIESLALMATAFPGPAMIARIVTPGRLRAAMGLWSAYMPAGMACALLVAPWIIAAAGWRALWFGNCLIAAVLMVLVWRWLPADGVKADRLGWRALIGPTLKAPGPWLLAACFGCYAGQWMSVFGFLPTLYAGEGIAIGVAGLLTAAGVAANVGGNLAAGFLAQRGVGRGVVLVSGSLTMAVAAWVIFGSGAPFPVRYAAVVLFSLAGGLVPGSLFATTPAFAPSLSTVSTTTGLMQQGSAIGQFVMPPLVAASVSAAGTWSVAWWLTGTLAVLTAILGRAIGRRLVS